MTTTTELLTCDEIHAGFDAFIDRVADLAAQRDHAKAERADLLEANCRLQQELAFTRMLASHATKDLARTRHALITRDADNEHLRADRDAKDVQIRRLTALLRESALDRENLQRRLDRDQQEAKPPRRYWPSCLSRRIGNQL